MFSQGLFNASSIEDLFDAVSIEDLVERFLKIESKNSMMFRLKNSMICVLTRYSDDCKECRSTDFRFCSSTLKSQPLTDSEISLVVALLDFIVYSADCMVNPDYMNNWISGLTPQATFEQTEVSMFSWWIIHLLFDELCWDALSYISA
ncbi:hypothetical protein RHSIM_Rhsim05G0212600 [Rhododendron simsii]|uniref:Uncharacterized protein n=1 Tax=Rhododendron simsii TaxID=118357 RepID=A0A834H1P1_RHOSS|nr:hypothetical protein RHSIM_Rhsim05G0212600 [Rhododendron simsii]